jgi:anti-sigma factor RsiW
VPERPDHPDREQLAAFEAGDGDRRERAGVAAHLAGCSSCAEVVASVERARSHLSLLEEPELPPGLHDRLAAAVEAEAAQAAADRPTPWYRRPVAWGAAAALLLAALVVPFLDQSGGDLTTASGGGAETAQEAAGPGQVPVLSLPGDISAATVSARLATDRQAKAALESAATGTPAGQAATPDSATAQPPQTQAGDNAYRAGSPTPQAATADLQPCVPAAAAAADPATRPLVPAFYIEGTYQGQPATVLVTTSNGDPGRVDLWVFPRDNCSSPPLATERVR